jgi:uncharacterized C2H2 Zn-finger protein
MITSPKGSSLSDLYRGHVWQCDRCEQEIRRTSNRDPNRASSATDTAYYMHNSNCGGQFLKIAEPPRSSTPSKKSPRKSTGQQRTIDSFLKSNASTQDKVDEELKCPICRQIFSRENLLSFKTHVNVCLDDLYSPPKQNDSSSQAKRLTSSQALTPSKRKLDITKSIKQEESKFPRLTLLFDEAVSSTDTQSHLFGRDDEPTENKNDVILLDELDENDDELFKPVTYHELTTITIPRAVELFKENEKVHAAEEEEEEQCRLAEEERIRKLEEEVERQRIAQEEEKAKQESQNNEQTSRSPLVVPPIPVRRTLFPHVKAERLAQQAPEPKRNVPPKISSNNQSANTARPVPRLPPKVLQKPPLITPRVAEVPPKEQQEDQQKEKATAVEYCLLCEAPFSNKEELLKHISTCSGGGLD